MEDYKDLEPSRPQSLIERVGNGIVTVWQRAKEWEASLDLNPHEGELRGRGMSSEHNDTSEHPPRHNDDI